MWTTRDAISLCKKVEDVCPAFGCHVALTGGTLYKEGARKDLDLMFYRIRQVARIDRDKLFHALAGIGLVKLRGFDWCYKCEYDGKPVDVFFPEHDPLESAGRHSEHV